MFSSLTTGVLWSPNCNAPRYESVRGIAIHHMAGCITAKICGEIFSDPDREASSNYGISDNDIYCYVDEDNRSWCTSGPWDNHLITIEVANDEYGGEWHISDTSINTLINLCVDICRRYNINLHYDGTQEATLVTHDLFASTECPGHYLKNLISSGYIEYEVKKRLGGVPQDDMVVYRILDDNGWSEEHNGYNEFDSENGYCQAVGHIRGISMYVLNGWIEYQVKVGENWLPMVKGYDIENENGYAGNGEPICAIRCFYHAPQGGNHNLCAYYRVGVANCGMQGEQKDDSTDDGMWGAAVGACYMPIDKFMIQIR